MIKTQLWFLYFYLGEDIKNRLVNIKPCNVKSSTWKRFIVIWAFIPVRIRHYCPSLYVVPCCCAWVCFNGRRQRNYPSRKKTIGCITWQCYLWIYMKIVHSNWDLRFPFWSTCYPLLQYICGLFAMLLLCRNGKNYSYLKCTTKMNKWKI